MNISTDIITYEDLFAEPRPDEKELLKDIDSDILIQVMSFINSHFYLCNNETLIEKHKDLFKIAFKSLPEKISIRLHSLINANKVLFVRSNILEFIQYIFLNFHLIEDFENTVPNHELNLIKAYLIISEKKIETSFNNKSTDKDQEVFYRFFWPFLAKQYDINKIDNPIFSLLKGALYLNYFKNKEEYNHYYEEFLENSGCNTGGEYIHKIIRLSQSGFEDEVIFKINVDSWHPFFKNLIFDHGKFLNEENCQKNFNGIKAGPLYRSVDNQLYILDWGFINRKLYDGLIRDFYQNTTISKTIVRFTDFLSRFSKEISEEHIFRKIMELSFSKNYNQILFNEFPKKYPVDCFIKYNQYIFLFEYKNNSFSSNSLDIGSFDSMKKEIDKKMNGNYGKTGIHQIINQIRCINELLESNNDLFGGKIKPRNIVIYPILIYSDKMFGMPGINDYLNSEFLKNISKLDNLKFRKVKNLVLINIDFFIQNLLRFKEGNLKFFKALVDDYIAKIEKRKQKHKSFPDINKYEQLFESFEDIQHSSSPYFFKINNSKDVKKIIELFNINIFE